MDKQFPAGNPLSSKEEAGKCEVGELNVHWDGQTIMSLNYIGKTHGWGVLFSKCKQHYYLWWV